MRITLETTCATVLDAREVFSPVALPEGMSRECLDAIISVLVDCQPLDENTLESIAIAVWRAMQERV